MREIQLAGLAGTSHFRQPEAPAELFLQRQLSLTMGLLRGRKRPGLILSYRIRIYPEKFFWGSGGGGVKESSVRKSSITQMSPQEDVPEPGCCPGRVSRCHLPAQQYPY